VRFEALIRCDALGCETLIEPHLGRCGWHRKGAHLDETPRPANPDPRGRGADRTARRATVVDTERIVAAETSPRRRKPKPKKIRITLQTARRIETVGERTTFARLGAAR
jgi:hypothetical protein